MALTQLEMSTVDRFINLAKKVLAEIEPELHQLNVIYDSGGGVKETVSQGNLNGESKYSGLTKAALDDGAYALTNTLKTAIDGAFAQLEQIASRSQ